MNEITGKVEKLILPKRSLKKLREQFCDRWRRTCSDEEFLEFMRDITADEERLPNNHKRNALRHFFKLSVGDEYYEINKDILFRLTE